MPLPNHRLIICGIPELSQHSLAGVSHVLSIIDTHEPRPPALDEFYDVDHELIRFDDVVAEHPGFEACTPNHIAKVLAFGERAHGVPDSHVLVHCHAGVSRSTASAALILAQARPDRPAHDALEAVAQLRPRAWPNLRILEFGDELLSRNGEIVAAVAAIYRRVLDRDPQWQEAMIDGGRSREVRAALSPADQR